MKRTQHKTWTALVRATHLIVCVLLLLPIVQRAAPAEGNGAQIPALSADIKTIIDILQKNISNQIATIQTKKSVIERYISTTERSSWEKASDHLNAAALSFLGAAVTEGQTRKELLKNSINEIAKFSPYLALRFDLDTAKRLAYQEFDATLQQLARDSDELQAKRAELAALDQKARQSGLLPAEKPQPPVDVSEIGAWDLKLGEQPSAILDFRKAVSPADPHVATFRNLTLSCGATKSLRYQLTTLNKSYNSVLIGEGEDNSLYKLGADGVLSSHEAARFSKAISQQIKSYIEHNENQQYIQILTEDMHGDTINFSGFDKARTALRSACAKLAPTQVGENQATPTTPIAPTEEISRWRDVISLVARLNQSGACRIPPFSPAAIAGLNQVKEISCGNGAGTRLSGQNGIGVFFHSVLNSPTARVDQAIDNMYLSSITIQIPSNLYTHVPPGNIQAALKAILVPAGLGNYADTATTALQQGQNSVLYNPHYSVSSFSNGGGVNSAQVFGYVIIMKCGTYEAPFPFCRR